MTERKIKQMEISFEPETSQNWQTKFANVSQAKYYYAVKHCHFFLWAITVNIVNYRCPAMQCFKCLYVVRVVANPPYNDAIRNRRQ